MANVGGRRNRGGHTFSRDQLLDDRIQELLGRLVALGLHHDLLGLAKCLAIALVDRLAQGIGGSYGMLERRQPDRFEQLLLQRDHFLVEAMRLHDGVAHLGLGQLFAEPFDHHHRLFGAGDNEVEVAVFELLGCREGDQLAVDACQANRTDRAQERHARQHRARPTIRSSTARPGR